MIFEMANIGSKSCLIHVMIMNKLGRLDYDIREAKEKGGKEIWRIWAHKRQRKKKL